MEICVAKDGLPITVVICTLNEEENIRECIVSVQSNRPSEVIVVDGGSTDRTVEYAKRFPVRIIETSKGLGHQTQVGIDNATQDYIALIHADDRCADRCLETLMQEMQTAGYWAIKAQTLSLEPCSYWEKAMDINIRLFMNRVGATKMVGRPAMFSREAFSVVGNDSFFTFSHEDTDLSRQMELAGLPQGRGTGIVYRKHLDSMGACFRQWKRYGEGDGRFVYKYPSRMPRVLFHLLIQYPIIKPLRAAWLGSGRYSGFFVMQGCVRTIWAVKEYLSLVFSKGLRRWT